MKIRRFGGDTLPLSVYTAVKGVFNFCLIPTLSTTGSSSPLLGILYGSRDKNGIVRTVREDVRIGLAASVIWCGLLAAALPLLPALPAACCLPVSSLP